MYLRSFLFASLSSPVLLCILRLLVNLLPLFSASQRLHQLVLVGCIFYLSNGHVQVIVSSPSHIYKRNQKCFYCYCYRYKKHPQIKVVTVCVCCVSVFLLCHLFTSRFHLYLALVVSLSLSWWQLCVFFTVTASVSSFHLWCSLDFAFDCVSSKILLWNKYIFIIRTVNWSNFTAACGKSNKDNRLYSRSRSSKGGVGGGGGEGEEVVVVESEKSDSESARLQRKSAPLQSTVWIGESAVFQCTFPAFPLTSLFFLHIHSSCLLESDFSRAIWNVNHTYVVCA